MSPGGGGSDREQQAAAPRYKNCRSPLENLKEKFLQLWKDMPWK